MWGALGRCPAGSSAYGAATIGGLAVDGGGGGGGGNDGSWREAGGTQDGWAASGMCSYIGCLTGSPVPCVLKCHFLLEGAAEGSEAAVL